jgi:hypothetical protein
VTLTIPPTFTVALGPNKKPAGFIRNKFALPNPVVWIVPKIFDMSPPVTRPRMFEVRGRDQFTGVLRKLAVSPESTLKLPKLWNRFVPALVPPVML